MVYWLRSPQFEADYWVCGYRNLWTQRSRLMTRKITYHPIRWCAVLPAAGWCNDDPFSVPRDAALLEQGSRAGEDITALPSRTQAMAPGVLSSACLATGKPCRQAPHPA